MLGQLFAAKTEMSKQPLAKKKKQKKTDKQAYKS